jgi:Tfp pilus assembly protein PilZ
VRIDQELVFVAKGAGRETGVGRDISLGGLFIVTANPAAFGAEVTVTVTLPGSETILSLPGIVRWTRADGMGVQFGLIGVRETHAIIELQREREAKT